MAHDAYTELKGLPELTGSINMHVSEVHKLRRPPSLSESFAWTPENVLRASNTSLDMLVGSTDIHSEPVFQTVESEPLRLRAAAARSCESAVINILLRFLFHITLISIFESVFFFLYVSQLEDGGINKTVGGFINSAVSTCSNFSPAEQVIANDFLSLFLNGTQIIAAGNMATLSRDISNTALFNRAWIYVGSLGGLFIFVAAYAQIRKHKIYWKHLILENFGLVLMLAAYEYMFFSTIITPYAPVSANEIAANAVILLQSNCHIL